MELRNPGPKPEHHLNLHVIKPPGNGPARVGSVGRPATPQQPGNPREGIWPAFLCWNRGKLCSSSPLPLPHWVKHGSGLGEGWVGEADRQSLSPGSRYAVPLTWHFWEYSQAGAQPLQNLLSSSPHSAWAEGHPENGRGAGSEVPAA